MARAARKPGVKARRQPPGTLVTVDGLRAGALRRMAKKLASADRRHGRHRAGISWWDASGIFGDLEAADPEVEKPSMRTLLLLYAADLVFRLRWEIQPALAEGQRVIAAPYVDTAIALGRAAGIDDGWLKTMFSFAPAPAERNYVKGVPGVGGEGDGFIEFACRCLAGRVTRSARQDIVTRAQRRLKAARNRKTSLPVP